MLSMAMSLLKPDPRMAVINTCSREADVLKLQTYDGIMTPKDVKLAQN